MKQPASTEFSYAEVRRILRRHRAKTCLFALAVLGVAGIYLISTPKTYESKAKLFFRVGRETIALDPTATTSAKTLQVFTSRESEINSALEALSSRPLVEQVVDKIGADRILADPREDTLLGKLLANLKVTDQLAGIRRRMSFSAETEKPDPAEEQLQQRRLAMSVVKSCIKFDAPKETTVVSIGCEASSPELAQQIVATYVDAYQVEHMRLNRTEGSLEFFTEQTDLLRDELENTTAQLTDAKNEMGIASLEGELQQLENHKAAIVAEQLRVGTESAIAKATCDSLKKKLVSLDEMAVAQRVEGSHEATDTMRSQLYELEMRERDYQSRYDENHPLMRAVRDQVVKVRAILEAEEESTEHTIYGANPIWRQAHLDLLTAEAKVFALGRAEESLAAQLQAVLKRIRDVNSLAMNVSRISRKADLLEKNYVAYSENLEQARIDSAIEDQRISNVNVIQEATLPSKPSGPKSKVIAGLALIAGVFGGAALAFCLEYLDPRLSSPAQVEAALDLPVLVTVPRSSRRRIAV